MTTLIVSVLLIAGMWQQSAPADSISLQYCYRQAAKNYPTAKNIELQRKITGLNVEIAHSGYFPQIDVRGKATYQSEVTEVLLPGGQGPPAPENDQYEASVDVTQTIFNAGAVGIRKDLERAKGQREIASTRVQLHQIRTQVDQVYFGLLLSKRQAETIQLMIKNLEEQLSAVRSRVENGVMLPSQQHILEAELIKARQDSADTRSNIRAGYAVLGEIIGEPVSINTGLMIPEVAANYRALQPQRSEYDEFESTQAVLNQQQELAETKQWPRISAFGTAAYGRPGLNFLSSEFHDYYIVGVRVQWNFWDAINSGRASEALQIQQQKITQNRRAFDQQLQASLDRISERIASIRENIKRDKEIVELRKKIMDETGSQLEYGVITATEYIAELTRANRAQLSLFINQVRLSQAQIDYMTTLGQPISTLK